MRKAIKAARLRGLGLVVVVLAASTAAVVHASGTAHGSTMSINWWDWNPHAPPMGWFFVDFAMFVGGLMYFAATPISRAFAQRHLGIKRAITDAATAHAKATSRQHEWRDKLSKVEVESRHLLERSQADGAAERERLVRDAKEYASRMLNDSQSQATQELQRARSRLQRSLMAKALRRAQELLVQELTDADRQRLVDDAIDALESGHGMAHAGKSAQSLRPGSAS